MPNSLCTMCMHGIPVKDICTQCGGCGHMCKARNRCEGTGFVVNYLVRFAVWSVNGHQFFSVPFNNRDDADNYLAELRKANENEFIKLYREVV